MSCMQITACGPHVKVRNISSSRSLISHPLCISPTYSRTCLKLNSNLSTYRGRKTVCLFGGGKKAENGNEDSPWKSLEKAMQGFRKEKSVQELLREQMQKREFGDEFGGGPGDPPSGGRGGGGGGESDEEFLRGVLDEIVQVVLGVLFFLFLYWYILKGSELISLIKDWLKFFVTRRKSVRLEEIFEKWGKFYRKLKRESTPPPKYWLEQQLLDTPTWWYKQEKLPRMERRKPRSNQKKKLKPPPDVRPNYDYLYQK